MNRVMGIVTVWIAFFLVACGPSEPETYTTSADVDDVSIPTMLAAIDGLTDNELPVEELLAMTNSVPMDEEKQQRVAVVFRGDETDMLIHIWREQADWVHVYASSTSKDLVDAVKGACKPFERSAAD